METDGFYKHITFQNGAYHIIKNNEKYGSYRTLEDALYERDRLMQVNWDWDKSMELEEIDNPYSKMKLPPFSHKPKYIYFNKESWVVRGKGKEQKYRGVYYSFEEANRVASLSDSNVVHRSPSYEVCKKIDGKSRYFGRFKTLEDAQERVKELEMNGWKNEFIE